MTEIQKNQRPIKGSFSPNISINSDSILSCCVKDLSFEIRNKDGEIEDFQTTNKRPSSPTKINISIDNGSDYENSNQLNESSRLSSKSNDDKRIYFSILLPKEYRESKNCKIQLSLDMNICLEDTQNQKSHRNSNVQSKNSLTNSSSNSISSTKSSSKSGLNKKNKIKQSIIDNLNTNEPMNINKSNGSISNGSKPSSKLGSTSRVMSNNGSKLGSTNKVMSNNSSRRVSNVSSRSSSKVQSNSSSRIQSNSSLDSPRKISMNRVNRDSNSYVKVDESGTSGDEDLMRIRQLKNDIDKVIDGEQNSNSKHSSQSSSVNTLQRFFGSKDSMSGKPPLANSSRSSSILKNLQSQDSIKEFSSISKSNSNVNRTEESLNENDDIIENLYLPQDNNRMKSKEDLALEIEESKNNDEFGMFSPVDDKEYNYLFDLIDNEYSVDDDVEPVNVNALGSDHSVNSSENENNSKVISKDPSIVYNDDNKEKLERCYSSSFELAGVWKNFIVPYMTDSQTKDKKPNKDCPSRVYDDYTTEAKKKAYHHWIKIMLPEYSTFISRHSLQTVCAQNYILASLIEKMSFFKMAEEDPNPVIRESPQYNVERLDICLSYMKNVMDIPIAVSPYDLHLGKLASIFSLLTQLIRYYKRGMKIKSKIEKKESDQLKGVESEDIDIEEYDEENEDENENENGDEDRENIKLLLNEYSEDNEQEVQEDNSLSFSKELNLAQ